VQSADTGWEKYSDVWTVSADGVEVAERILTHPHETEQPSTRSLSDVEVLEGTEIVTIAVRDLLEGFCGVTYDLHLP